jgi:hypothetical protein
MDERGFGRPAIGRSGWKLRLMAAVVLLALAGLGGCVVEVQQPATPAAAQPSIILDPPGGPAGTLISAQGQGWVPGSLVSIYLAPPGQSEPSGQALVSAPADAQGRIQVAFAIPSQPSWEGPGAATVVARAEAGPAFAQASLGVTGAPPAPTPTSTVSITASDVLASPVPGATRSSGPAPAPPGQPSATANTDLNVRAGPGTDYPIIGLLRGGQSAEITGLSPGGAWWQIRLLGEGGGRGWVSGGYVTTQNTGDVPLVRPPAPPPTATPVPIAGWRGEYFANPDLAGAPALVRDDPDLNFDWGPNAPGPGVTDDNFSARWTRDVTFSAGNYRFYAYVDDGARVWVDGDLVIDQWHESTPTTYTADLTLAEGAHTLRMEYYEHTGNAIAQLGWERATDYPDWRGEYFDNPGLNGTPVLVRNDANVDFYWSESPGPGVPADNFSVRWTRGLYFPGGTYRFSLDVDDGARLWVDDQLVIDGWRSGPPKGYTAGLGLGEGTHTLRVEYFEFRYVAQVHLNIGVADEGGNWEADYFDNEKLRDDPVLERQDNFINFNWGTGSPGPEVPADNFSARWTQNIRFDGGTYLFSAWVDDGVRLWVDDILVLESWEAGRFRQIKAEYHLGGGTHRVRVEYFEHTGDARIDVSWDRQ